MQAIKELIEIMEQYIANIEYKLEQGYISDEMVEELVGRINDVAGRLKDIDLSIVPKVSAKEVNVQQKIQEWIKQADMSREEQEAEGIEINDYELNQMYEAVEILEELKTPEASKLLEEYYNGHEAKTQSGEEWDVIADSEWLIDVDTYLRSIGSGVTASVKSKYKKQMADKSKEEIEKALADLKEKLMTHDLDKELYKEKIKVLEKLLTPAEVKEITKEVEEKIEDKEEKVEAKKMTDKGQEYMSNKIKKLMDEGMEQDQAVAVAYKYARKKGYDVPKTNIKTSAKEYGMKPIKEIREEIEKLEKENVEPKLAEKMISDLREEIRTMVDDTPNVYWDFNERMKKIKNKYKISGKLEASKIEAYTRMGDQVDVEEPSGDDMWQHSFTGTVIDRKTDSDGTAIYVIEDQEGNSWDVPRHKFQIVNGSRVEADVGGLKNFIVNIKPVMTKLKNNEKLTSEDRKALVDFYTEVLNNGEDFPEIKNYILNMKDMFKLVQEGKRFEPKSIIDFYVEVTHNIQGSKIEADREHWWKIWKSFGQSMDKCIQEATYTDVNNPETYCKWLSDVAMSKVKAFQDKAIQEYWQLYVDAGLIEGDYFGEPFSIGNIKEGDEVEKDGKIYTIFNVAPNMVVLKDANTGERLKMLDFGEQVEDGAIVIKKKTEASEPSVGKQLVSKYEGAVSKFVEANKEAPIDDFLKSPLFADFRNDAIKMLAEGVQAGKIDIEELDNMFSACRIELSEVELNKIVSADPPMPKTKAPSGQKWTKQVDAGGVVTWVLTNID